MAGATPVLDRVGAAGPPLELGAWSLEPAGLELLLSAIDPDHERVVECGSGASTIAIARLLAARGHGSVTALEHDARWAARVARSLEREGLAPHGRVLEAPLRDDPDAQPGCRWYDRAALAELDGPIDVLLVDGPPAGEPELERARYPALPALASRLRPEALVLLDDAGRRGERWTLERWRREGLELDPRSTRRLAVGVYLPAESPVRGRAQNRERMA